MKKREFDILIQIEENPSVSVSVLSALLFRDEETIHEDIDNLIIEGYLSSDTQISSKGKKYLSNHKIDNAIILSAGMSTRFVPLSYEIPKGLLPVQGEPLIERQINQLKEKGINEIIVVVGYMKEKFEYLKDKFGVILVEADDYEKKNNHASVYAAREYLKNSIITSSDLYFSENLFQRYAYDSYYCCVYESGKTVERGIETDEDDKIVRTMYGDQCFDIWVTLGYAYFSEQFSSNYLDIMKTEFNLPETAPKFWADIQDEHLSELYMYAKFCNRNDIHEFDSLEELRCFDPNYLYDSGSSILHKISNMLAVRENNIIGIESLWRIKHSCFKFRCKGDFYICDIVPSEQERINYQGQLYYQCAALEDGSVNLYKLDKTVHMHIMEKFDVTDELNEIYDLTKNFKEYHDRALPLCAAENVISPFASLPLSFGFQERYIMNNTYSFNMEDNFVGCEKLFPYYKKISEACERIFGAKYTDARPFTGMHCIDMVVKTICKPGDKMIILGKEHGGHASVQPVVERLGIKVYKAPYNIEEFDLDYEEINRMVQEYEIKYILLAPSDLIRPLNVDRIDTSSCVLMWDCSQLMGLIAAGLCANPLKTKRNVIMFGGTHKTFPGPASGLIMTNETYLHDKMERMINPILLRNSQMHQKICLLFAMLEFEQFGDAYMSHMVHCSNYLGEKLREKGFDVADIHGQISQTHQVFIRTTKEEMETMYHNAFKCEVTLNKKQKDMFLGYGIRLGTQEIARYDWNDEALDIIADIIFRLSYPECDVTAVKELMKSLPSKEIKYTFSDEVYQHFKELMISD